VTKTVPAPEAFDLLGPLPEGTTVLEASAGTGKTFTIAALVARYVAEDVATMDQLLVVSFSRESTRELRERVRERPCRRHDRFDKGQDNPIDERRRKQQRCWRGDDQPCPDSTANRDSTTVRRR